MKKLVPTCHYCKINMEPGIELNRNRPRWLEGEPEFDWADRPKVSGRKMDWIVEYRCPECGLIEKFANERLPGAPQPLIETVQDE